MIDFFKSKTNLLLSGILLLAAFLRLYRISDYMTFLGDEGRDVLVVYNILHGKFTLLGPTSSVGGFFLGPIYYYFMAPFLWLFNYDPVGPAIMVAIVGVITVWLVYKIGAQFFNTQAGVIAAFLYTISPVVIAYSRSSWNPNLMPITSLLCLYTLYNAVTRNNKWLFIVCGVLLGIAMQLHYLSTFLGVIVLIYIACVNYLNNKKLITVLKKSVEENIIVFVGFIIGWIPFLAFEARHGFLNIKSILKFVFHSSDVGGSGGSYFSTVGNVIFRIFARLATKYPPPEQVSIKAHTDIAIWFFLTLLLIVLSLGVFIYQYRNALQKRDKNMYALSLFAVWFLVGVLLFGFYRKPIYDYYFGFMFPLPFLLIGNMLSVFWTKNIVFKVVSASSLIGLIWINLTGVPFLSSPNRQKDQVKQIAEFVLSKTDNKPYNFALITPGNSDHGYRYFFKIEGKDPVEILNPQVDPQRKSVTDQLLIVCEDPNCHPLGNGLWEVAGFGRAEIAGTWEVSVVKVFKLVHYKGK